MKFKEVKLKPLLLANKDYYNQLFFTHAQPCSDYCFSVIQTWLSYAGPVNFSKLSQNLILLEYTDVLDSDKPSKNYTLIGDSKEINNDTINLLEQIREDKHNKVVITHPHAKVVEKLLPTNYKLTAEPGLHDYIYSVDGFASLEGPQYRRIRREVSIYHRDYPSTVPSLKKLDLSSSAEIVRILNSHHSWDKTFKFDNDPDREEGLVIDMGLRIAKELELKCAGYYVDQRLCGFFIYTEVKMPDAIYADVHHARFSYEYKYMNDYAFHLLAKLLKSENIKFINFERDADIIGLRQHKQLLNPTRLIKNYSLQTA